MKGYDYTYYCRYYCTIVNYFRIHVQLPGETQKQS